MKLVNLLDLLEATGNQADAELAARLRAVLDRVAEDAEEVETGGY